MKQDIEVEAVDAIEVAIVRLEDIRSALYLNNRDGWVDDIDRIIKGLRKAIEGTE